MKKYLLIAVVIFMAILFIAQPVFAQGYLHFGRNPMVPGGLKIPASGAKFMPAPRDFQNVSMQGASGEWVTGILPAGTLLEVYSSQVQVGKTTYEEFRACRVVKCGNTVTNIYWRVPVTTQIQQQEQRQNINVTVIFTAPQPKPNYDLVMNSKMNGRTSSGPSYINVGSGNIRTVTWSDTNIKNVNGNLNNSNSNTNSQTQQQQQQQNQNQQQQTNVDNHPNNSVVVDNTNNNNNINQNSSINNNANANQ